MEFFYPIFIAFTFVFISELGDKTQLMVLSFSSKIKTLPILLGVALGSFLSHGIAILFGSSIGMFENIALHHTLEIITYTSFILFGIVSFLPKKETSVKNSKDSFFKKLSSLGIGYMLIIAISIAIGEIGDKTFLASVGLGISYPFAKFPLIIGAILGMVLSDCLAILCGKFLTSKISEKSMQRLSGILFLIFGIIGFITHCF